MNALYYSALENSLEHKGVEIMEHYIHLVDLLRNLLIKWGVSVFFADIFKIVIVFAAILLLAWIANFVAKRIILTILHQMVKRSKNTWDDIIFERKVFNHLSWIAPALVIYHTISFPLDGYTTWINLVHTLCLIYMTIVSLLVLLSFVDALHEIYLTFPVSKERTIKGYLQVIKIILYIIVAIIILSIVSGVEAAKLFTGLGAMAAVLMFVFKDTILGLVASIQLSANDMLKPGDWIEMPSKKADGSVIDISLTTVKVQNWDKTIVTIPTYSLVSESFTNWRGMELSDGRRVKKILPVDVNTIKFCTTELVDKLRKKPLLQPFFESNSLEGLTNLTLFRAYMEAFLRNHPSVNTDMTILANITVVEGGNGVSLQYIVFLKEKAGVPYEKIQSAILEHFMASISEFNLKIFQNPTGNDVRVNN